MGLHDICPQNNLWLVPIKNVCQFISIIIFLFLGARGESSSIDFGRAISEIFMALHSHVALLQTPIPTNDPCRWVPGKIVEVRSRLANYWQVGFAVGVVNFSGAVRMCCFLLECTLLMTGCNLSSKGIWYCPLPHSQPV